MNKSELRACMKALTEAYREAHGEIPVHASLSNPNPIKTGAARRAPDDLRSEEWQTYIGQLKDGKYVPDLPLERPLRAKRPKPKPTSEDHRGFKNIGPQWKD